MQAYDPNGISIGSAVFAQMATECPHTLQRTAPFPLKIAPSHGRCGPHLIHGSLGPPESSTQTASRSVQLYLYSPHSCGNGFLPRDAAMLAWSWQS